MIEAQVQAFVGKPVLESELVSVLGRFLGIEWVTTGLSGVDLPLETAEELARVDEPLPEMLREKIAPLLRIGHVQGLLDLLDEHALHEPSHKALTLRLRAMVLRFDFESMIALTKEPVDD